MYYFRPNPRRRFAPVIPSPFRMAPSSNKQPFPPKTQFIVSGQPRPSHTYHMQQSAMTPQYFDVDQSVDNFGPQQQARTLLTHVWDLPTVQRSASVNSYSQSQTPVQINSRKYYHEDAPNALYTSEPSYVIMNSSQEASNPTTVRIIRADGSAIEEIAELHQHCHAEGCCVVSDPIDDHLQEEPRRERSPSRDPSPLRVRRPYRSPRPEEQSQDEELDQGTAGFDGSVAEEGFGLNREQILAELELLVTIMRQLLVEYRGLEVMGEEEEEEESEHEDAGVMGEDEDAGESVEGRA